MDDETNNLTYDEVKSRLGSLMADRQAFFGTLGDFGVAPCDDAVVKALVQLHAEGLICIPELLDGITRKDVDYWTLVIVLVKALAHTDIPPEQFLASLRGMIAPSRGDIAMLDLTESIQSYCGTREEAGTKFIDACLALPRNEERTILLASALIGLGKGCPVAGHARSLVLSSHEDPTVRVPAMVALGSLDYGEHAAFLPDTQSRFLLLLNDEAAEVRAALAKPLAAILQASLVPELAGALLALCHDNNTEVTTAVVGALASVLAKADAGWWRDALRAVLERPTSNPAELQRLDHLLGRMAHADPAKAVPWIEHWAAHQASKAIVSDLDMTVRHLLGNRDVLCRCVTRWFRQDNVLLHALAAHLVRKHAERRHLDRFDPLILDKAELEEMKVADVLFALRKITGHCFAYEDDLVSLVFSATRKTDPSGGVRSLVVDIFANVIGINYPGTTAEFLKTVQGDCAKAVAERIEAELAEYFDPLRKLPVLREGQVLEVNRQKLAAARNACDARAMKEVQEHSILMHIAHHAYVKHGRAFFVRMGDEAVTGQKPVLGEPTPFVCHSFTTEVPRESALDPVGLDWRLMCLRVEKRLGGRQ